MLCRSLGDIAGLKHDGSLLSSAGIVEHVFVLLLFLNLVDEELHFLLDGAGQVALDLAVAEE